MLTVFRRRALGMHDAATRHHPVYVAGRNALHAAETVAMQDAAFEQVRDGRKPDMRMRTHVDAASRREIRRPHVIEKDERPDQQIGRAHV